jgi:hypothetical protein
MAREGAVDRREDYAYEDEAGRAAQRAVAARVEVAIITLLLFILCVASSTGTIA